MNKKLIVLVGLPGSGKSTWIEKYLTDVDSDAVVVSSDNEVEKIAKELGKTYSEVFKDVIKQATKAVNDLAEKSFLDNKNVIWDQTNLSKQKRMSILQRFKGYQKIACVFEVPKDVLEQRLKDRAEATGKFIPDAVVETMRKTFEYPEMSEGFDKIIGSPYEIFKEKKD